VLRVACIHMGRVEALYPIQMLEVTSLDPTNHFKIKTEISAITTHDNSSTN
jgi:hypothetical protein